MVDSAFKDTGILDFFDTSREVPYYYAESAFDLLGNSRLQNELVDITTLRLMLGIRGVFIGDR